MNNLMLFQNHQIEVINFKGNALFNPTHVAKILDIKNVRDNIAKMNTNQVIQLTNSDVGKADFRKLNNRGENFLTKSGVYKLIFKSHKPNAEQFQDWVTDEVLPQIEHTGGYVNNSSQFTDFYFSDCDSPTKQFISTLLDEKVKLTSKVNELLPKAKTYDMIMDADGTFSMNQVAKSVGMGEYKLFEFLRKHKILFYEGADNVPYERFRKNKCFKVVVTIDYRGQAHSTTKIYPKGIDYICKIIAKSERAVA